MKIDQEQHLKQLQLLGYSNGDTVFYRLIPGKGYGKASATNKQKILPELPQSHGETLGCYFVVNGGGHKDDDVKFCRAFFAEWDDRSLEEQENLWVTKGFLKPTFQVKTRKSIHCYWVLTEPMPVDDWKILQTNLLNYLDADRSLKNPSRVLRVAGAWHVKAGEDPVQCELINVTGQLYWQGEIEKAITPPTPLAPPPKIQSVSTGIVPPVPLYNCLPRRDRDLVTEGAKEGSRNQTGYGLAKDLISTENYLKIEGISYGDSAYNLFLDYCRRCDQTDWGEREWEQVWRSAEKDAPASPPLDADAIDNCLKKWARENGAKYQVKTSTPLKEISQYDDDDQGEDGQTTADPKYPAHVRATNEIYGDGHYISLDGNIYGFNGTHYEKLDQGEETRKFRDWAERNPVYDPKTEKQTYMYMTPAFLEKCWKWAVAEFAIKDTRTNPPGLNLKNGVLRFDFKGRKVSWELSPHSPQDYFLYCSEVEYKPDADPEMAHRLLEALDPDPRMVFLRTIAAAIDLENVRKVLGRGVRAAICRGSGANGKDSLKEAITLLFGDRQIASATFGDFVSYDQGRKFDLAKLRGVRFNWPSENNQKNTLDLSESMNAAITGDRGLVYERKGKDGEDFTCQAVHLFNCNQLPKMKTGLDSLKTRFCVLDFFKTYKPDPDPSRGELLADPRFKYDRQFMIQEVCPSLLNLILAELPLLLAEGINYDLIADSLEDIQEESTHLWEFCKEYGIVPDPKGQVWVHDLWFKLQTFYEENGTLERVDKPDGGYKNVWHDQANKWDANITGPNQIFKRFKQLFPKIDKRRETKDPDFKGRFYLYGISANSASPASLSQSSVVFASPSASPSFTNSNSASLTSFPLGSGEVKQKVKQNGKIGEAETLDISSGEAGEAKKGKIGPENPQKKSNGHLTADQKLVAERVNELKTALGWDATILRQVCKDKYQKTAFVELTEAEMLDLVVYMESWN